MSSNKNKKIDLENIKPEEKLKYEIAEELGYMGKVMSTGWKSLTAKESGRIGGLMTKRRRETQKQDENDIKSTGGEVKGLESKGIESKDVEITDKSYME